MVEIEGLGAWDSIVLAPGLGRPVASRVEEAMKDGEIDSTLDVELEVSIGEQSPKGGLDAGFDPKATKDEIRADAGEAGRLDLPGLVGIEDGETVGETESGAKEGVELAGFLEQIQPSEGGEDALANLGAFASALGDLEVLVRTRRFDPEEHGEMRWPYKAD
jgi:hypothetical protein